MKGGLSRRRQRSQAVRQHLAHRDIRGLVALARQEQGTLAVLLAALLEREALIRWRAIEALGQIAADWATDDLARVRDLVRRQFWSMNDESGGIAWHAPEAIGEILFNVPALAEEFLLNLASFHDMHPFQPGVHWALARIAEARPELLRELVSELTCSLEAEDPWIRGHAAKALVLLGVEAVLPPSAQTQRLVLYDMDSGELRDSSVGELAGG